MNDEQDHPEPAVLGPLDAFLHRGEWLAVSSSNVSSARYDPAEQMLIIQYRDGGEYGYSPVSEAEATAFANASSHGTWLWDNVRIRGSKTGHRKSVSKI